MAYNKNIHTFVFGILFTAFETHHCQMYCLSLVHTYAFVCMHWFIIFYVKGWVFFAVPSKLWMCPSFPLMHTQTLHRPGLFSLFFQDCCLHHCTWQAGLKTINVNLNYKLLVSLWHLFSQHQYETESFFWLRI